MVNTPVKAETTSVKRTTPMWEGPFGFPLFRGLGRELHARQCQRHQFDEIGFVIDDEGGGTGHGIRLQATGYKGHQEKETQVHIVDWRKKKISSSLHNVMKKRARVEPVIGHMKKDNGTSRHHLLGTQGDAISALLMAIGFNLRKCMGALAHQIALFFLFVFGSEPTPIRWTRFSIT